MNYDVVEANYVRDFIVWLRFQDGSCGEVDLEPVIWGPMFEPLQDRAYFAAFHIHPEFRTLTWPNGADIAPEYLHERVQGTHAASRSSS
ncbi:MAG: DUF2442 domain-containing protein [Acidobacteriota bacterium]